MILRDEVFYSTGNEVRRGDEYYQIVLDNETAYPQDMPFKVAVFHGNAGDGNREPESEAFYARKDEAENGFSRKVNELLESGFKYYSPAIHGIHDF